MEPYDWASFLRTRLDGHSPSAPLEGLTRGGYRLVYTDKPSAYTKAAEAHGRIDLSTSIGLSADKDGKLDQVEWASPAFQAGLVPGSTVVSVDGAAYDGDALKTAVTMAKTSGAIDLIVKSEGGVAPVRITYSGGLRYPHLERVPGTPDRIGEIFSAAP